MKRAIPGINDVFTTNPELKTEWNYEKNTEINPETLLAGSGKRVWWICSKGHEWEAPICGRIRPKKTECPICGFRKIITGINDLFSTNPELKKEWDYQKNTLIDPDLLSRGTKEKVWWKCAKCNYEWMASVSARCHNKTGCPACSGNVVVSGKNDLLTVRPELEKEWNYNRNGEIKPSDVAMFSNRKVWWICTKGHEWQATVGSRANRKRGTGCPYCSGRFAIKGENDLETLYPIIAQEWDYSKNVGLLPSDVKMGSSKRVWWKCSKCGHEWQSSVYNRIEYRSCPKCSGNGTSYPEQAILFYVRKVYPDAIHRDKHLGKELDIYIPSINVAIEYDGELAHKSKSRLENDNNKDLLCKENGVRLIRIRDESLPDTVFAERITHYGHVRKKTIEECIVALLSRLECQSDFVVDTEKDFEQIMKNYYVPVKEKSLAVTNPELIDEWHVQRNGNLKPENVTRGSERKAWWICSKCNYEWSAAIINRAKGIGCPRCSNKVFIEGETDIYTAAPELMLDWNYSKNESINPHMTPRWSKEKAWWHCHKCGYEWKSEIGSRFSGIGCPNCSGKILIVGENDLKTRFPEVAKEWDYDKNKGINPEDFFPSSNKKVWWRCKEGHEWETMINTRTRDGRGSGCPICSGKAVLPGFNDLASVFPDLLAEWDYSKNLNKPSEITAHSGKKVWWQCSKCKYEWEAIVANRTKGHGCPKCSGHVKDTPEEYKLKFDSRYPWLELLSDYEGAKKDVLLKCKKCNHIWKRAPRKLNEGYIYCPKCGK